MALDTIMEFLRSGPELSPPPRTDRKVVYIILNSLGSILLVDDYRRVVRKKLNHNDIHIDAPLDYLARFRDDPQISISMGPETRVYMVYCHKVIQAFRSHCRGIALLGSVTLAFAHYRTQTEDAQVDHARHCQCGHLCYRPPMYILSAGDRLVLPTGTYYIRACADSHTIYLSKNDYLTELQYYPASAENAEKLMKFVQALPDNAGDFI